MRLTIYFNQARMIEWGLNPNHAALVCALNQAHTWAEASVIDGKMFFWVSRKRVMDELPGFFTKSDTVYRAFRHLADKGLIEYIKQGDRDMIHLTEKFKKWNVAPRSEINPNLGNEPEPRNEIRKSSEINPNYLGNESDILDTTGLDTSGLDIPPAGECAPAPPEPEPPKPKRRSKADEFVAFVVARGVDEATARDWWQYRAGKPMTESAWQRHCAQAEAAGISVQEAAAFAAGKEWRAFYAEGYQREQSDLALARQVGQPLAPQGRTFDQQGREVVQPAGVPSGFGAATMPQQRTSKVAQGISLLEELKDEIRRGKV
mgnify:CR=1 FL=1